MTITMNSLLNIFPNLTIINNNIWNENPLLKKLQISLPPLTLRVSEIESLSHIIDKNRQYTLFTVPANFNSDFLRKIELTYKKEIFNQDYSFSSPLIDFNENVPAIHNKSEYIVLMTDSVIKETQNCNYQTQKSIVEKLKMEVPDYLSASLHILLNFLNNKNKKILHNINGDEFSRCTNNILVGGWKFPEIDISRFQIMQEQMSVTSNTLKEEEYVEGMEEKDEKSSPEYYFIKTLRSAETINQTIGMFGMHILRKS